MIEFNTILSFIQAAGIIVGLAYYILNIQNNQRNQELSLKAQQQTLETRQAQLYMQIYNTLNTREMCEADYINQHLELKTIEDWEKLQEDKEKWVAWTQWGNLLEGIGVLLREDLIDISHLARLLSGTIIWWWEKYESFIMEFRRELDFPRAMIELEYLHDELVKYSEDHPELQIVSPRLP